MKGGRIQILQASTPRVQGWGRQPSRGWLLVTSLDAWRQAFESRRAHLGWCALKTQSNAYLPLSVLASIGSRPTCVLVLQIPRFFTHGPRGLCWIVRSIIRTKKGADAVSFAALLD